MLRKFCLTSFICTTLVTLSSSMASLSALALTTSDVQTLLPQDGPVRSFGNRVAVSGDTVLVGANGDSNSNGAAAGAAYVFVRDPSGIWNQQAKLIAEDGFDGDSFGYFVALDGDVALIGAPQDDDNGQTSGSAYVFVRDARGIWSQQAKLLASDGTEGDFFGDSIGIRGDTIVIGARLDDDYGSRAGSAYVFVRDTGGTWRQQAKLLASDGGRNASFGDSVAIEEDAVLIGAPSTSAGGAAYLFTRDAQGSWDQQSILSGDDGALVFGIDVAFSGNTALIGDFRGDGIVSGTGTAYIFTRDTSNNWSQQTKLFASDGAERDLFGRLVALDGDRAFVADSESVNMYLRNDDGTWSEQGRLLATDGTEIGAGGSVVVDGNIVLIGARSSVYVLDLSSDIEDEDGDTVPDETDMCVGTLSGEAVDTNGCSDSQVDQDGDNFCDPSAVSVGPSMCVGIDNCPILFNDQTDANGDGFGDACVAPNSNVSNGSFGSNPIIGSGVAVNVGASFGDNATLGANSTIRRNVSAGNDIDIGENVIVRRDSKLGDSVVLGDGAVIAAQVTIGNNVVVADGAVIRTNSTLGNNVVVAAGALVRGNSTLGDGVVLGENAVVAAEVTIGNNVTLGAGAKVGKGVNLADGVHIEANASIGSDVTIGNDVIVGPGSNIRSNVTVGADVRIGSNVAIAREVSIGNDVQIGLDCPAAASAGVAPCVAVQIGGNILGQNEIGTEVILRRNVTVPAGHCIADGTTVNANTTVISLCAL